MAMPRPAYVTREYLKWEKQQPQYQEACRRWRAMGIRVED